MDSVGLVHVMTVSLTLKLFRGQLGFMKGHGFDIRIICSPGENVDEFERAEGVPVTGVPMLRQITPVRDLVALWKIYRELRRLRPGIVHAHTPKGGLLGMLAAWLARVPVRIYHIRGLPFMSAQGGRRRLLRFTERLSCMLSHRVLCVSGSVRSVAIVEHLCPEGKIRVLHNGSSNGVDARVRFNPDAAQGDQGADVRRRHGIPGDAVVLGFVGRIVADKGIRELVDAWRLLRRDWPRLHLLVVGDFEPQDPVPAEVKTLLSTDPRVHLTGAVSDTTSAYMAMDIAVLPSYREGFPNVLLEAAAMRLPVVATSIPGCVDAVEDGVTGVLVPVGDGPALASGIRRYLHAPQLRRAHGEAARARVLSDFEQEKVWAALREEYISLLRMQDTPAPYPAGTPG